MKAIVLGAGKGTRLQSEKFQLPKVLRQANGRALIDYVLEHINFIPKKDTVVVVGYKKEDVRAALSPEYLFSDQDQQLGTGHAVMTCAEAFKDFDGTVLITFGDMPLFRRSELEKMCLQHQQNQADCTLMTAENPELKLWARVLRDAQGNFNAIVEGKDCTPEQAQIKELFSGVMAFNSKSLFEILPQVGCANVQQEYYVTEVPELMVKQGMKVQTYFTDDGDDLRGINTPEDLEICEKILLKRYAVV